MEQQLGVLCLRMSFVCCFSSARPALGNCREPTSLLNSLVSFFRSTNYNFFAGVLHTNYTAQGISVRLRAAEPVITSIAIMDPSSSTATDSWSITSWLSSNPNYIAVLLVAIILPLILFVDRIGINPTVAAGPTAKSKSPSKKEAKKNK